MHAILQYYLVHECLWTEKRYTLHSTEDRKRREWHTEQSRERKKKYKTSNVDNITNSEKGTMMKTGKFPDEGKKIKRGQNHKHTHTRTGQKKESKKPCKTCSHWIPTYLKLKNI